MDRGAFVGTVAGGVLTAPLTARAQSQNGRIVRIGYLDGSSPSARTSLIVGHMRQHRLPAMCSIREYAQSGCLISYGPSYADHFRRAASVIDKILKGAKPGDLPVQQPTKFRAGDQPPDRQGAGVDDSAVTADTGGPGDRVDRT